MQTASKEQGRGDKNISPYLTPQMHFVVVGAGPSGLAFATACTIAGHSVEMIEREATVGGCHRVIRVDGAFTEHSPRVYSSSYANFISLLREMGLDFHQMFTPYDFNIAKIGSAHLSWREKAVIVREFFAFVLGVSKNETMNSMCRSFSPASREYLDRLCRLTDGGGIDRYGKEEFMQLANQEFFNRLYQPKQPNDTGLFKQWTAFLSASTKINTNAKVVSIDTDGKSITGVRIGDGRVIKGDAYVFCVPPQALVELMPDPVLRDFAEGTEYADYISITYHWKPQLQLKKIWGFPASSWGLAFIVQSNYTASIEAEYATVITCAVTLTNRPGYNGKTANECSSSEILQEAYLQLKEAYPDLPDADLALMNPNVYFKSDEKKWESADSAYFKNALLAKQFISNETPFDNGYNCGCHNGQSFYGFTSLEGAVTNAIDLSNRIVPGCNRQLRRTVEVKGVILTVLVAVIGGLLLVNRYHQEKTKL